MIPSVFEVRVLFVIWLPLEMKAAEIPLRQLEIELLSIILSCDSLIPIPHREFPEPCIVLFRILFLLQ